MVLATSLRSGEFWFCEIVFFSPEMFRRQRIERQQNIPSKYDVSCVKGFERTQDLGHLIVKFW